MWLPSSRLPLAVKILSSTSEPPEDRLCRMLPRAMRKLQQQHQQQLRGNHDEMERREADVLKSLQREADVLKSLQREGYVYFEKVLKATHVCLLGAPKRSGPCQLALPAWFVRDHGDTFHRSVTLECGASGRVWPAHLFVYGELVKPRVMFSRGWKTFAISNDLRAGDRLIFSLKAVSKFVVYIFRRAVTTKRMLPRAITASRANSGTATRINCESRNKAKQQTFGRQSYTSCPELFASEGIHEPQFIDSSSDEEFALPAHFKLTLAEKPSSGVECHRRLRRRREVLAQEEDYNTLAADDDDEEGGDQKLDVPSEFNRLFAKFKRVSPSTDYNSTSNSDHSFPGRPSSNSDYSILYGKPNAFPRRGNHTTKYMEETSTGQRNQWLQGQAHNKHITEHSGEDDLFPTASRRRQSKSSSSASFSKVLGVCNVHRNASNGFLELPCKFLRKHVEQIEEVVRLQGVYEDSPVRSVDCTVRFTKNMQQPRLYLKPGWLDFVHENQLQIGQELIFTLTAPSFFVVRKLQRARTV